MNYDPDMFDETPRPKPGRTAPSRIRRAWRRLLHVLGVHTPYPWNQYRCTICGRPLPRG